jgi:hypothetical protein
VFVWLRLQAEKETRIASQNPRGNTGKNWANASIQPSLQVREIPCKSVSVSRRGNFVFSESQQSDAIGVQRLSRQTLTMASYYDIDAILTDAQVSEIQPSFGQLSNDYVESTMYI